MCCSYAAVPCLTGLTCKDVAPQNSSPQYSDYRPKASRGPTKAFITDRSLPCNRLMPVTGGVGVARAIEPGPGHGDKGWSHPAAAGASASSQLP